MSFIPIELPLALLLSSRTEDLNKLNFQFENSKIYAQYSKNIKKEIYQNINTEFGNNLKEDLLKFGSDLIYLIALDDNLNENDFVLDIESDIQYEKDNTFYAEGNAVLNFSNAELKGDKITYNKDNKTLIIKGNVVFIKGNQFFEASKVLYNLSTNKGFIENIYGVLDLNHLTSDFEFKNIEQKNEIESNEVFDLKYIDSIKGGLSNDFQGGVKNLLSFDISSIKKWRYKAKKITFNQNIVASKRIIFTNDPFNDPQFILESKNFTGEIEDSKIRLISRENFINLDDKLKIPLGKRNIYDDDYENTVSWGIGSDYKEKDGFYLYRKSNNLKLNDEFFINLRPYFLIQRSLQGSSNSFREKNEKILSNKVSNDINFSDVFALDTEIIGSINNWNIDWESNLNTFNVSRFHEAVRSKLTLQKTIVLNNSKYKFENNSDKIIFYNKYDDLKNIDNIQINKDEDNISQNIKNENFQNFLDIKFTTAYRDKVSKGYEGESEIYFGNSFSLANRKSWLTNHTKNNLSLIYDVGNFKAKSKKANIFNNLNRNVFALKFSNNYQLWKKNKKNKKNKTITEDYKYSPIIINQGIRWNSNIQSGIFLYSDGSSQKAISFSSGPEIILGALKRKFLDYSGINFNGIYVLKEGESPFEFDDINKNFRLNIELKQQLLGPIILSYGTSYDFDKGVYLKPRYKVDINRRAYSVGAFYNSNNESIGINFNIYNFDYRGFTNKFKSK